jgi:GNAT superfamily N-acetyltransferase
MDAIYDRSSIQEHLPMPPYTPIPPDEIERRLNRFLQSRLGTWPPTDTLTLNPCELRDQPGWDGDFRPFVGIETPHGTVISYSTTVFPTAITLDPVTVEDELMQSDAYITIPRLFGRPDMHFGRGVFRSVEQPADLPEIGEWVSREDPRIPAWLKPFNGDVLVAWDEEGNYAAGVGLKRHNELGSEIAVGTEPHHRGQGLAKKLVAQAARAVLAEGGIPMYLHGDHNAASGRVADGAGFPDRGWHIIEVRAGGPPG